MPDVGHPTPRRRMLAGERGQALDLLVRCRQGCLGFRPAVAEGGCVRLELGDAGRGAGARLYVTDFGNGIKLRLHCLFGCGLPPHLFPDLAASPSRFRSLDGLPQQAHCVTVRSWPALMIATSPSGPRTVSVLTVVRSRALWSQAGRGSSNVGREPASGRRRPPDQDRGSAGSANGGGGRQSPVPMSLNASTYT